MADAARELSITYGSIIIGGISTDYLLDNWTRHEVKDGTADSWIEFDCVVKASTVEALAPLYQALERTFRSPRKSLTVSQSGQVLLQAHHTDAEGGFNTEPSIRKVGDVGDSGRSRRYTLRVTWETPADTVSTSGLRESNINVAYDASRIRTIRISGTFTGVPDTPNARDRYDSAIGAHVTSALSALSVTTSELIGEPVTEQDYDNKTLRFERIHLELIFGQGQDSPNDDAAITDQTLTVTRREISEERSPATGVGAATAGVVAAGTVQALAIFDLHYEASIDNTSSTALKSKYDSIRAWLLGQFGAVFSQGTYALTVEKVDTDRVKNRLIVDMTAEGSVRGALLLRRTVTSQTDTTAPTVFRGAWTGNPDDFYIYQGHSVKLKIVIATARHLTTKDPAQVEAQNKEFAQGFGGSGGGGGSGFVIRSVSSSTAVRIGIEGSGHVLNMVDVTSTVTKRIANSVGSGGGAIGHGTVQFDIPSPIGGLVRN